MPADRVLARTNAAGETPRYRHDVMGRVVERTAPTGEATSFTYDWAGRLA
ncbi:hypothetical protein E1265_24965 [Streptomyces sp. 8K308]|nr:RHS repeat domain-containing protein [Streptomyces sp. 8K308]TDC18635.1 hypothetical protein E1265_24965 [Streptomyces sp. 8K308]